MSEGKPVLFSPGADWLYAYQPGDGKELWKLKLWQTRFLDFVPRPVAGHGMLYMSTSFMRPAVVGHQV